MQIQQNNLNKKLIIKFILGVRMPIVRMPDGVKVRFPEDMPAEQIRDMIASKFPEVVQKTKTQPAVSKNEKVEWTPERQAILDEVKANMPEKSSALRDFGEGFIKGVSGGIERLASGATLGAYDWASDKLGLGAKERKKELYDLTGTTGKVIGTGLEIIGGVAPGAGIAKATTAGLKAIPKVGAGVAKVASIPLSGGVESAIQTGFDTDSLRGVASGFGYGAALSGIIGGGLGLGRNLFSTRTATKGVKGGLENAVKSSSGARLLSRGVGASDDVASMIRKQGQEALEETNKRTLKALDTAIGQRTSVSDEMAKAKRAYADFIDENKANQVIKGKFTPEEYQKNLKNWFKGSQVVDEAGKPLKLYHGTEADFDVFDITKGRKNMDIQGSFFSPYELDARGYGPNVKEVYLNIKNPADEGTAFSVLKKYQGQNGAGIKAREELQRMGYDGVFNGYDEYIAFDPKQIKSVQNTGAFSKSPSISDKDFIKPPTSKDLGLADLSNYQQKALDDAWTMGANQLKPNEKIGSLKHLDEMKKQLNKMIPGTQTPKATGIGLQDTPDTVALRELKGKLKEVMDNSGLTDISKQYAQAENLQNAYDLGLNYNAGAVKTRKLPFSTQAEKQAFADGLMERISMGTDTKNVSKAILDNQRVLKEVLPEKKVSKLLRVAGENETAYGRIEQLGRKAETKLRTPEANRLFAREQGESKGALFGSILDYLNDKARAGVFTRGSKRVLDPNFVPKTGIRIGDILTPVISSDIISKNINIGEE